MKAEERSIGALLMALLSLGLLAAAYVGPWFEYDFSSGRTTPPGGPQPEEVTGIERDELDFYATHWEGDVEPADPDKAGDALWAMENGIIAAAVALAIVVLAEIPWVARLLRRRFSLVVIALALAVVGTVTVLAWMWLPESMAGYGIDSQYTARLDEPDGYTHSTLNWGWYAMALATAGVFATGLFKFQAGSSDPAMVEHHAGPKQAADGDE